ncbi:MAG: hypothetical protein K2K09_02180, partial [Lachnospiraceae bacterium]|nr:hypothetical protein [Lachnospiraceae bacterium]
SFNESVRQIKYVGVRLIGTAVCLGVDEVVGMRSFDDGDVFGMPEVFTSETDYFTKVVHVGNNRLALVIAPEMLIPGVDQASISEFVSKLE